jgi:hypothetical protein
MEELIDALTELEGEQRKIVDAYIRAAQLDEEYRELGNRLIKIRYFIRVKVPCR